VVTGDWHSTFVNEIRYDYRDPRSATVMSEIVTPAITSNGDGEVYGPYYGPMIPSNPHIRYFDGDRKGYVRASVTRDRLRADVRFVDRVGSPRGGHHDRRQLRRPRRRPSRSPSLTAGAQRRAGLGR
jgi:alkaline phosphatase D